MSQDANNNNESVNKVGQFFKDWGAKFTDDEGLMQGGKKNRFMGRARDKYDEYKISREAKKALEEVDIGNDETPSLLKDTEADFSYKASTGGYKAPTSGARKSFFESMDNPLVMKGPKMGSKTPGMFKGLGDFANNPMIKEAGNAYNVGKNFGIGGYVGQAIFNSIDPRLNLDLGGKLPSLNWSPNSNTNLSVGPDIKTDSGYGGIKVSGSYDF